MVLRVSLNAQDAHLGFSLRSENCEPAARAAELQGASPSGRAVIRKYLLWTPPDPLRPLFRRLEVDFSLASCSREVCHKWNPPGGAGCPPSPVVRNPPPLGPNDG